MKFSMNKLNLIKREMAAREWEITKLAIAEAKYENAIKQAKQELLNAYAIYLNDCYQECKAYKSVLLTQTGIQHESDIENATDRVYIIAKILLISDMQNVS